MSETIRAGGYATALRASPRAFGLNLLLQLALHILPPISFFVPFLTGFIAGWQIRARPGEAAVLGLGMASLMFVLCGLIGAGLIVLFPAIGWIPVVLVGSVLVVHLAAFAACGAAVGGHYARKDEPPSSGGLGAEA
jgi:hypothetical protein